MMSVPMDHGQAKQMQSNAKSKLKQQNGLWVKTPQSDSNLGVDTLYTQS